MAGIVTHLVYAQEVGDKGEGFLMGNILPDINYITSKIDRAVLHLDRKQLEDAEAAKKELENQLVEGVGEGLIRGMVFHGWVDLVWSEGVWIESDSKYLGMALKLWLDEKLWERLTSKEEIVEEISKYQDRRVFKRVPVKKHNQWYEVVKRYLGSQGGKEARLRLMEDVGLDSQAGMEVNEMIESRLIREDKVLEVLESNLGNKHEFMRI